MAMLIAAGAVATFYNTVSTGTLLRRSTETRATLALEAFLLLDRVGAGLPLREGLDQRGRANGLEWRVLVTGQAPQGAGLSLADPGLLHVYVSVFPPGRPDLAYELHAARYRDRPL